MPLGSTGCDGTNYVANDDVLVAGASLGCTDDVTAVAHDDVIVAGAFVGWTGDVAGAGVGPVRCCTSAGLV